MGACEVGTMATAGGTCVPVGTRAVPDGFEPEPGKWGFHAISPFGICDKDQRSVLGAAKCRYVDDCRIEFPPPNATVVHDQAELVLALAGAKAGDTIALDDGTYEPIELDRSVNLYGRCASTVFIRGTAAVDRQGVAVDGPHTVAIRGVTVADVAWGIWAGGGAKVTVDDTAFIDDLAAGWVVAGASLDVTDSLVSARADIMADGILVGKNGHATIKNSELRNMHVALHARAPGATVRGEALIVSERSPEPMSAVVIASQGGAVHVDRSLLFVDESFIGGSTGTTPGESGSAPASLKIENSELYRVAPVSAGGFDVSDGSSLELINVTFASRTRVAISAHKSAKVLLERSVLRPILDSDIQKGGIGAGIIVNDDARLTVDGTAILGMAQSAIAASNGCSVRVTGSLIADTWEFERTGFDKRMKSGQAVSLSGNAQLTVIDTTLQNNAGAAIWMDAGDTKLEMERSLFLDTREAARSNGLVGLVAWAGTLDVRASLFHGIPGTAIALGDATGAISRTVLSKSDVAFRFMGRTKLVPVVDEARRPEAGEITSLGNVLVETRAAEVSEPLDVGVAAARSRAGSGSQVPLVVLGCTQPTNHVPFGIVSRVLVPQPW